MAAGSASNPLYRPASRGLLMGGASATALGLLLAANPVFAQAGMFGRSAKIAVPNAAQISAQPVLTPKMQNILARHQAYQARVSGQAKVVSEANAAARAAAAAAAQTVRNGLGAGGLDPVANAVKSALSANGLNVWEGADAPTQTQNGALVDVSVNQTQSRALLSWNSFNVGRDTTVTFNQQGHGDWVVVNRVVGGINPATGLTDPAFAPTPSQILGSIKADGSVYVLNRSGVLFGATAQVNLHSLVASTLELGSSTVATGITSSPIRALSLAERNNAYLQNGILTGEVSGLLGSVVGETHGAVDVAQGARINANGGFVILAAPRVSSAGELKATVGGQVSLEAGKEIDAYSSTGGADSVDPYVRGLVLASVGGGTVDVSGSIDAPQGYISLGTDQTGSISLGGILTSTTSVSRNGKISLIGGTVDIAAKAAISITPDNSSGTIPQSADSIAAFKTSQIDIGSHYYQQTLGRVVSGTEGSVSDLLPSTIRIGTDAIIQAPSADVNIGGTASGRTYYAEEGLIAASTVDIASGAVIDVSGIADYLLSASRNQLELSPAKRNELRDTPTYRESTTDGGFTLNGATLYVDPRISGVREDGVAWIGSPLLEAGSLAEQIGITASELMTTGGNVTLATLARNDPDRPLPVSAVTIANDATIDFAGGWVRYQDGFVRSSKLVTADGRIVDIANADPNDRYVAVANGFVENLPQLSSPRVYANSLVGDARFEQGYAEGRDAGSLTVRASTTALAGDLHGEAVAGLRQITDAREASAAATLTGDIRKLQTVVGELPAGGLLHIQAFLGGDFRVGGSDSGLAEGTTHLSQSILNDAHLSGLSLQTSGSVSFAAGSSISLADGGAVNVDAGRAIHFAGALSAAGGSITARTFGDQLGSLFDTGDDLAIDGVLGGNNAVGMFDITVGDGAVLSTRGRWVNDLLATDGVYGGAGYTSGGSITLGAAPHVAMFSDTTKARAIDLSGSILVRQGSLLDVSGGGYVSPSGALDLSGKGGDVSLINETVYFQLQQTDSTNNGLLSGTSLFRSDLTTFNLTSVANVGYNSAIVPDEINARVDIADGTLRGFGFEGGGTFKLVTPDLNFGSSGGTGTAIPLDFLQRTGFGTLDLSAWNTALIDNVFSKSRVSRTALLATEQVRINAGETLNLTQARMPTILTQGQIEAAQLLATGTDVSRTAILAPTSALGDFDNLPANLVLGGLIELDVLGGTITGAPGATITTPKLYNDGTIRIAGGTITQRQILPASYVGDNPAIGVHVVTDSDGVDRGAGLSVVFGAADAGGKYDELADNALGIGLSGNVLSNRELLSAFQSDRQIYYLGQLDADQGILFSAASVTDLSGASIRDPRTAVRPDGSSIATGRLIDGGTIQALGLFIGQSPLFETPFDRGVSYRVGSSAETYVPAGRQAALQIDAVGGAAIDISGVSDIYDIQATGTTYTPTPVWSNGGTISALGGGSIADATVDARGGAEQALGGTLEWFNPVLRQSGSGGIANAVSADQIMDSGFSSFIARGVLNTDGDVDLTLGRSFVLTSPDFLGVNITGTGYYATSIGSTGNLSITAPHIGLLSLDPEVSLLPDLLTRVDSPFALTLSGGSIDISGGIAIGASFGDVTLNSTGDIRFIGVQPLARRFSDNPTVDPSLGGGLVVPGDLLLRAAQVYATTGTGNLQQLAENPAAKASPFLIASVGGQSIGGAVRGKADATIRIERMGDATRAAPLSAGSYISIIAPNIEQAGVLRAPLGRLDLGSRSGALVKLGQTFVSVKTDTLTLEDNSVTSVSANGLAIPYGTTTDLTEYYFSPSVVAPITRAPAAQLSLAGTNIVTGDGATVDVTGGGDVYAYEFVSGTGGSRDVLSRFNTDAFSGNDGYQYPDQRQVYAIVPASSAAATVALYDPIYSGDYGALYGADVGKMVRLDGAPGVPAGDYVLLPAQYATLPGAMRLVENVGAVAPVAGFASNLLDGSVQLGGVYGVAGTGFAESQRRSFTVQSQAAFSRYSRIEKTSGTQAFTRLNSQNGDALPRMPVDAARVVLDPLTSLHIGAAFDTTARDGGRGSQVDILGDILTVVSTFSGSSTSGGAELAVADLDKLNASSLLIGGTRTDLTDGSTNIRVTAKTLTIANDAANPLSAPEIMLAVDGVGSQLTVADGASIVASGTLTDTRSGDYNVAYFATDSSGQAVGDNVGAGAVLRIANGVERLIDRSGPLAEAVTQSRAGLTIGAATLSGTALALDVSRNMDIDPLAALAVEKLALGSDNISFSSRTFAVAGLVITPELEQTLASIGKLTLRSANVIGFTPGTHQFNDLTIDAPGVRALSPVAGKTSQTLAVDIAVAGELAIRNNSGDLGACTVSGALACGTAGNSLGIVADSLRFGSGTFRTYGFDGSVSIQATNGTWYEGDGVLDVGDAALSFTTPFLVDRGTGTMPTEDGAVQAALSILTTSTLTLSSPTGGASVAPTTPLAPGARLTMGSLSSPIRSVSIDNVLLRATAGTIDVKAQGDIALTGTTTLATPSYSQSFGDAADAVTVSANGGIVALLSKTGGIATDTGTRFSIGGSTGKAGTLRLLASEGSVNLGGTIDASAPGAGASLTLDSGTAAFDFAAFASTLGTAFTGDVAVRTGVGDLTLDAGQSLKLTSLSLTADGGSTTVAGRIDTSGINGGAIALFGRDGVTLAQTAVLDSHAGGYADTDTRRASGGAITLGVGEGGAISVASGATLDLGARRQGDRLVGKQQTDPRTLNQTTSYTYVEADQGGALLLRAPVVTQGGNDGVNIAFAGAVTGADTVTIEGYRRYDLAAIAADPAFTGVTVAGGTATLDIGTAAASKANFFADNAPGTLADFIQTFDISSSRANFGSLSSLTGYHEKPGVELGYSGDIVLASNWNLGAGTVDITGALADGDMRLSSLGTYADGTPRYDVIAGREAHLFQNHVAMLYRVGGRVDGEAGVLTLRAGGDLDLQHSITDGFFAFSDQTDPDFISYELGGGQRRYRPSVAISCGRQDCESLADFALDTTGQVTLPPARTSIDLTLSKVSTGEEILTVLTAPYSVVANAAAPTGLQAGGAGDPIGSAQLFPLLADGSAADSFSLRLVGGAGNTNSANPLHVSAASDGSMILSGETSYTLASVKATGSYTGGVQLDFGNANQYLTDGDLFNSFALQAGVDPQSLRTKAARVQFGKVSGTAVAFLQAEALSFFAAYPAEVQFVGPANAPTGFTTTFERLAQFLQSTDSSGTTVLERFGAQIVDGSFGYAVPSARGAGLNPANGTVNVRSLVRTGTGSIDVAAAADVDITNGPAVLRNKNGGKIAATNGQLAQVGGTAIYTAGHVVNPTAVTARVAGTNQTLTIDPTAYLPQADLRTPKWEPTRSGRLQTNPVFATDGGSISVSALDNVLGRRDVWSESFNPNNAGGDTIGGLTRVLSGPDMIGTGDQRWRVGDMGSDGLSTTIRVNAQQFSSGFGTLGGGDISIQAGGDARELTVALDTTVATGDVGDSFGSMVFGGGNLDVTVGGDIAGGRFDISTGVANLTAGGEIGSSGLMTLVPRPGKKVDVQTENLTELRTTDAVIRLAAGGDIALGKVTALGVNREDVPEFSTPSADANALGYYTGTSAVIAVAGGDFSIAGGPPIANTLASAVKVLPATLDVTSFSGNIDLGKLDTVLYPSATGQLSLLAGGTLRSAAIDLDDGEASLMPGIFSAVKYNNGLLSFGREFGLPTIVANTSDATRRLYHNVNPTHVGDSMPARIAVGGDLTNLTLFLAKQARISAGRDIVNMVFTGQNLASGDATRIVAGRDITATTTRTGSSSSFAAGRSVVQGNSFVLGGPGALFLEAGRNMGPFLNSATIDNVSVNGGNVSFDEGTSSYAGGVQAVGNDYNPWLAPKSADIYAFFGVAPGMNFDALRETYVNPANVEALDGDLFEQNVDQFGNKTPDRSRPIYSPVLVKWMQENQADALIAAFGTTDVSAEQAYSVFAGLPQLAQRRFLLDQVYFNELAAPSRPDGVSYLQYVRGYRAVETLFPTSLGYTANDLSGAANGGTRVSTGDLDLRLAAIETTRDSTITILGPGGSAVLGSVVRTSAQAAGRAYQPQIFGQSATWLRPTANSLNFQVRSIPVGYEGVLTLRGGTIHGFTDGDFRLNQSRLFAQQSGDIVLWSSNGDLNAGQGPKSAANVPPVVLRFNPNAGSEVDTASGVVGAGIAGFAGIRRLDPATGQFLLVDVLNDSDVAEALVQLAALPKGAQVTINGKTYTRDLPTITLVAPAGTVDAGDAGVQAGGDIFVAAATVANADNFKVGGSATGIPALAPAAAPAAPSSAASAAVANVFRSNQASAADDRSRITVDVLGVYNFNDQCTDENGNPKDNCEAQ